MAYMCRALYDLVASHAGSLSMREGEKFLILKEANSDNPHWWYVVNGLGEMGYVPKNYVNIEQVSRECVIQEVDDLLELLHSNPNPTTRSRNLLKTLIKLRNRNGEDITPPDAAKKECSASSPPAVIDTYNAAKDLVVFNSPPSSVKSPNSPDLVSLHSSENVNCFQDISKVILPSLEENGEIAEVCLDQTVQAELPENDCSTTDAATDIDTDFNTKNKELDFGKSDDVPPSAATFVETEVQTLEMEFSLPPVLVPELVDQVRSQTHLSYATSILAVATTLDTLKVHLPHLSVICDNISKELSLLKVAGTNSQVFESRDRDRLLSIFHRLWSCKEDSQQRSWPLQEDETVILDHLSHLKQLLVDADCRVCCEVIQLENYECVQTLVTYYQMEARRCLRLAVLEVLELMCYIDVKVVEQLLSSVLPTELVLDMLNHSDDVDRFMVSARLLSFVFCTGQPPPRTVYGHINLSFASWILDHLEGVLEGKVNEETANTDLCVLLAVNLHLLRREENFVIEAVRVRDCTPAALTEKLMLLINREDDPVKLPNTNGTSQVPNSVLKFLLDLFSDPVCAQHFYVNDIKVLLDIIVRQLTDLPAATQRRLDYLRLVKFIFSNTCYSEHKHQREGIAFSLESILEHEDFSQEEKDFAQTLISEFPHLFTFA